VCTCGKVFRAPRAFSLTYATCIFQLRLLALGLTLAAVAASDFQFSRQSNAFPKIGSPKVWITTLVTAGVKPGPAVNCGPGRPISLDITLRLVLKPAVEVGVVDHGRAARFSKTKGNSIALVRALHPALFHGVLVAAVCHSERAGVLTAFGLPAMPIAAGEVSSLCNRLWLLVQMSGVSPSPDAKLPCGVEPRVLTRNLFLGRCWQDGR
jgi:hypothetical protein